MNSDDILSLPRFFAAIKREKKLIGLVTLVFFLFAVFYLLIASAKYTAKTSILLDPEQTAMVAAISAKSSGRFEDAAIVSQIEVLKSRRVAQKALEYLSQNSDGLTAKSDPVYMEELLEKIKDGLRVYREGESYVLQIQYTSTDPVVSAERANAFAKAYIYNQINSFSEDSQETEKWLKDKISEFREQGVQANLEIQKYRKDNNLIGSTRGSTVNGQQLENINDRLGDAKAEVATTRVRYLHSQEIIKNKNIAAAVAEAFDNDVINNIRAEYLANQQKLLELTRKLGGEHKTVLNLRKKQSESRNVIFAEMRRISESLKADYEVALAKEKSLEKSLDKLVGVQFSNDEQSFALEALEKEAESYSTLYDEYLMKYETMQQQASFPVSGSRIITMAVPPLEKSHPKSMIILGMSLILGAGFGFILALIKDNFDATFKRAGQIENLTGLHFLGFFPKFNAKNIGSPKASDFLDSEYSQSVDMPMSLQAETCKNIKITANKKSGQGCKVIGITTDNPHGGKSVMASNLALYLAQSGKRCLLVDADIRNPSISEENFVKVDQGLNAVLTKNVKAQDAIIRDSKTNLYVLPTEQTGQAYGANLVSSENMQSLIDNSKENFDYIIVDLPPMSATADVSFATVFVDYFMLVLEWGKSKPNSLDFNLKVNEIAKDKVLGVVLSQANMKELAKNYGHKLYSEYTKD